MSRFKIRLKELIKENGITQTQITKELLLSKNQIHYWIKGRCEPSIDDLIKLANYLNVCIDYLVGRKDYF